MPITTHGIDHQAVLAFIVEQQQSPSTACAYLGKDAEDILGDLEALDQPWTETLLVSTDDDGRFTGAAAIEWDEELGRSWVYGPWMEQDVWETDGPALLAAVTSQAPVDDHEIYADTAHWQMAELATRSGWRRGESNYEYARTTTVPAGAPDPQLRPATAEDMPGIRALHEEHFPGTYASAAELVEADSSYSTLVHIDQGMNGDVEGTAVRAYAAYQLQGEDTVYLDFIAVDPSARRKGIGARLISAVQQQAEREKVALTVDEHRPEAQAFYRALGFDQVASTRPYRSRH